MSVNLQINQGGRVWHLKLQIIEPQKLWRCLSRRNKKKGRKTQLIKSWNKTYDRKLFLLVNYWSDMYCFVISSFESTQLNCFINFERVSFLQSRRNQVEITSQGSCRKTFQKDWCQASYNCTEAFQDSMVLIITKRANRRIDIFVSTFCLINTCLSLSDEANKIKTLNIERA